MPSRELVIAFDADDTLWHNENIFEDVHARYRDMLASYHGTEAVEDAFFATEMRNLDLYGYGVKGFTLSAIETAIQLTGGKISAEEIRQLIDLGRTMLAHPVELLDGVAETLAALAPAHRLLVITKGDLRDQERKLSKSGVADYFKAAEIVSEKDTATYASILKRHDILPENFLMVGNSLKSDIFPVTALGGYAVHLPYHITWKHERSDVIPLEKNHFFTLGSLRDLPPLIEKLMVERA
ncbi:HAD family hydrolase [Rariglobus hedericola]|uniref:HAD family hydrolase n=1 Tax=Rariglobus hedericola TaxID=2597822 RepID=A0A556QJ72_9BACT|nr:HAD family hydrolase [Rariglobus hedericola]TSJ76705.1 HAD family hydrolase [Rariglobus hedericola]